MKDGDLIRQQQEIHENALNAWVDAAWDLGYVVEEIKFAEVGPSMGPVAVYDSNSGVIKLSGRNIVKEKDDLFRKPGHSVCAECGTYVCPGCGKPRC